MEQYLKIPKNTLNTLKSVLRIYLKDRILRKLTLKEDFWLKGNKYKLKGLAAIEQLSYLVINNAHALSREPDFKLGKQHHFRLK